MEQNAKWMENKRQNVDFSPKDMSQCSQFSASIDVIESPLHKYASMKKRVDERQPQVTINVVEDQEEAPIPKKKQERNFEGTEDIVEDFEMSDDEE
jgi:hypothetical protein